MAWSCEEIGSIDITKVIAFCAKQFVIGLLMTYSMIASSSEIDFEWDRHQVITFV